VKTLSAVKTSTSLVSNRKTWICTIHILIMTTFYLTKSIQVFLMQVHWRQAAAVGKWNRSWASVSCRSGFPDSFPYSRELKRLNSRWNGKTRCHQLCSKVSEDAVCTESCRLAWRAQTVVEVASNWMGRDEVDTPDSMHRVCMSTVRQNCKAYISFQP